MSSFSIAIHGGAGTILPELMTPEKETAYTEALREALLVGHKIMEQNGSALDAVEASVVSLENHPLFNAGRGAVFTHECTNEFDASIMCGNNWQAGAVAAVKGIKNPVKLARAIMEHSGHVMLCEDGAAKFAKQMGLEFENPEYFYTEDRYQQWLAIKDSDAYQLDHSDEKKFGTVGAVALDKDGNLAAATSTGGMTNKQFGRIGDSPIIGAGTYANNKTCAVSCTGHGEYFIKAVVAYDISCLMEYQGLSLQEACELVVNKKLVDFGGEGGVIAADAMGNIAMPFNSPGMYRAAKRNNEPELIAIFK